MRKWILGFVLASLILGLSAKTSSADEALEIVDARVTRVDEVVVQEGLRIQGVEIEIQEGEYKGGVYGLQVPLETMFVRSLKVDDSIKVSVSNIGENVYFQFYDFARSNNYYWLFLLFLVILIAFVGIKGIRTLIPSILLILFLIIGIIPDFLPKLGVLTGSLAVTFLITCITGWIRLRQKLLVVIVCLAVVLSLLVGFLVFAGFSQISYIVPFLGSVTTIDENIYLGVLDITLISVIFIAAGGVINASVQIVKHLAEKHIIGEVNKIQQMLKEGFKVSQKISAGELNNLMIMMIGVSLSGIFLLKQQFSNMKFWDNGWVSLQIITMVSAGLSILLITPITVLITAAGFSIFRKKVNVRGGQRRFAMRRRK
jgi:uncharacterized membrane protein